MPSGNHSKNLLRKFLSNYHYVTARSYYTKKSLTPESVRDEYLSWYHPTSRLFYLIQTAHMNVTCSYTSLPTHVFLILFQTLQQSCSSGKFNTISELRRLTAGDLHSLQENIALLCTFNAFSYKIIIDILKTKVKDFFFCDISIAVTGHILVSIHTILMPFRIAID